ncbi:hypothetical protein GQ457_17G010160 [Hibiscus cannabinus]
MYINELEKDEPVDVLEALQHPGWRNVVSKEYNTLLCNDTWELQSLPADRKPIGCKWIFRTKRKLDEGKKEILTQLFHRVVKMRAKRNLIRGINVGLNTMADPGKIKHRAFDYFQQQSNVKGRNWEPVLNLVFKSLSKEEVARLEIPFTEEEIKEAVWR